jgi:hypothetical protein
MDVAAKLERRVAELEHVIPRPATPPVPVTARAWTSPSSVTPPNRRPAPDASVGPISSPAPSRSTSPAAEYAAAACVSSRSSPTRRHRPHPARRPRSACASSSRPAPLAPLTARPFGDVFTPVRPNPSSLPRSGPWPDTSSCSRFSLRPGLCQIFPSARPPLRCDLLTAPLRTHPRAQISTSKYLINL